MLRYLVLLAEDDPSAWDRATDAERQEVFRQHAEFDRAVRGRGRMVAGEALAGVESATTLRPADHAGGDGAREVTEGPFAETVEQLGGFYLIDVDDLDVAVELCQLLPSGYTIELRPAIDVGG
ncbi:MAG TPA: YciI family protein [Segeticoccus sp.]|jgi:hypothetical protein|nr:YciI family protein [Segeticoccus sp.]